VVFTDPADYDSRFDKDFEPVKCCVIGWLVKVTESCIMDKCNDGIKTVNMFVDGQPSTEFKDHTLRDEEQISVEYG